MFKTEAKINVWFLLGPILLGLLAAFLFPMTIMDRHRDGQRIAARQIGILMAALDSYKSDVGDYPTTTIGLAALRMRPKGVKNWNGPYATRDFVDPWDRPFIYRFPGTHGNNPDLLSYGADGQPGGEGINADISHLLRTD